MGLAGADQVTLCAALRSKRKRGRPDGRPLCVVNNRKKPCSSSSQKREQIVGHHQQVLPVRCGDDAMFDVLGALLDKCIYLIDGRPSCPSLMKISTFFRLAK